MRPIVGCPLRLASPSARSWREMTPVTRRRGVGRALAPGRRMGGQAKKLRGKRPSPESLPAWDPESGLLRVLVDTPRGSAVKYKLDAEKGVCKVAHVLPSGMVFPYDFGSIPGTLADDGDPLDLLVIAEAGTFPGCLVEVRLIGGIQARQTQRGRTARNDRLVGVAAESRADVRTRRLGD